MTLFNPTSKEMALMWDGKVVTTIGPMEFVSFEENHLYEKAKKELINLTSNVRDIKQTDQFSMQAIEREVCDV